MLNSTMNSTLIIMSSDSKNTTYESLIIMSAVIAFIGFLYSTDFFLRKKPIIEAVVTIIENDHMAIIINDLPASNDTFEPHAILIEGDFIPNHIPNIDR